VQVKGLMPPKTALARKHPPAEPLGEMWYGITFSPVQKFVMLGDNFIGKRQILRLPLNLTPLL